MQSSWFWTNLFNMCSVCEANLKVNRKTETDQDQSLEQKEPPEWLSPCPVFSKSLGPGAPADGGWLQAG
ncbi:hypothetical protein NHX12_029215 [Muraenolepis orangiensis]|uniref:Uncharacterized protein n=1 Tax=Muraenolepis orangiensis TaxID=630683 RepID=A0A9Q0EFL3_9TELE|nr:hypothetical protein NHX12_029215 [Muraenolepis orangiensis]